MTREEIIEGLKLLEDNMVYFDELLNDKGEYIDVHELLFEAIEVLEQEPCEDCQRIYKTNPYYDCISRQNAIDAIWLDLDEDTAHKVRDILEVQPAVVLKQEPCEDCISREEALECIGATSITEANRIANLPSVQPKQKTDVLDKIRAEIEQEYNRLSATRADETLEIGECLGLKMSLKIIDKYKAESEEV